MTEVKATIIRNLEEARDRNGLKNTDIAEYLGVSKGAVTNWFKGINFIDVDNLYKLCMRLGITLDQVFGLVPMFAESLNPLERKLVSAFREAPEGRKESAMALLEKKEEKNDMSQTEILPIYYTKEETP